MLHVQVGVGVRLCHELDRYITLHLGKELTWVCRQQLSDQPYATLLLTTLLQRFFLALCYTQCLQHTEAECLRHKPLFPLCRETGYELQVTFAAICAVVQHTGQDLDHDKLYIIRPCTYMDQARNTYNECIAATFCLARFLRRAMPTKL